MPAWYALVNTSTHELHKEGPLDDFGLVFGGTIDPVSGALSRSATEIVHDDATNTTTTTQRVIDDAEPGHVVLTFDLTPAERSGLQWDTASSAFVPIVTTQPSAAPPIVTTLGKREFIARIGNTALAAAFTLRATTTDTQLAGAIDALTFTIDNASTVDVNDPDTIRGVALLEQLKLISAADVARILAPPTTEG